jgi:branched-subunit amino acid transport protein
MERVEMNNFWLVMLAAGLATYLIRLSFIYLFGRVDAPAWLRRALRFVPPAVLTAIIFPELLIPGGRLDISYANPRLLAGVLAGLIAWKTKNVILTIAVGMIGLYLLQVIIK